MNKSFPLSAFFSDVSALAVFAELLLELGAVASVEGADEVFAAVASVLVSEALASILTVLLSCVLSAVLAVLSDFFAASVALGVVVDLVAAV